VENLYYNRNREKLFKLMRIYRQKNIKMI